MAASLILSCCELDFVNVGLQESSVWLLKANSDVVVHWSDSWNDWNLRILADSRCYQHTDMETCRAKHSEHVIEHVC